MVDQTGYREPYDFVENPTGQWSTEKSMLVVSSCRSERLSHLTLPNLTLFRTIKSIVSGYICL